jgi:PRTRC genetic system protein C
MEIAQLTREFQYKGITLPDPNPTMTVKEVMNFYANEYPELLSGSVDAGTVKDDKLVFEVKTVLGTKG